MFKPMFQCVPFLCTIHLNIICLNQCFNVTGGGNVALYAAPNPFLCTLHLNKICLNQCSNVSQGSILSDNMGPIIKQCVPGVHSFRQHGSLCKVISPGTIMYNDRTPRPQDSDVKWDILLWILFVHMSSRYT